MVVNLLLRSVIIGLHHERSSFNDLRSVLDTHRMQFWSGFQAMQCRLIQLVHFEHRSS